LALPENEIKQIAFIFLLINFKVFFLYFKNSFTYERKIFWIIFFDYYLRGIRTETQERNGILIGKLLS